MPSRRCPHCKVVSSYRSPFNRVTFDPEAKSILRVDQCLDDECGGHCAVIFTNDNCDKQLAIFPSLEEEPDELLPEGVRVAFRQALRSLNEKIWDGCVLMARRALEEAMADLEAEGKDLYKKIEYLAESKRITPDLKDWAHEGRLGGNLGAHGHQDGRKWSDQADAEEIVEFAKWFFRYVYILPKQLEERRERLASRVTPVEERGGDPG